MKTQADDMSPDRAKQQFGVVIQAIKDKTKELMKTREGRDIIRGTFGCRIEGFENEGNPGGGLFDSPMQ